MEKDGVYDSLDRGNLLLRKQIKALERKERLD